MSNNMWTVILLVGIIVGITLYLGEFNMSFKDGFKVSMPNWFEAVSFFLLLVGFTFYGAAKHVNGYTEGKNEAYEEFREIIDQALEDVKSLKEEKDESRNI